MDNNKIEKEKINSENECCHCTAWRRVENTSNITIGKCLKNAPVGKTVTLEEADRCKEYLYIFPTVLSFQTCLQYVGKEGVETKEDKIIKAEA